MPNPVTEPHYKIEQRVNSVKVLDLCNRQNCVIHTMHYMARGKTLTERQVKKEKKKILRQVDFEREPHFRDFMKMNGSDFTWKKDELQDTAKYCDKIYHNITTIAAYARVLGVNVRLYIQDEQIEFNPSPQNSWNWISLYVESATESETHHMYGVIESYKGKEGKALQGSCSRIRTTWKPFEDSHVNYWKSVQDKESAAANFINDPAGGCAWVYTHIEDGTKRGEDTEEDKGMYHVLKQVDTYVKWRIGMYAPNNITKATNQVRKEAGQQRLIEERDVRECELKLQGHDPGSFVQAKVIHTHTNNLRALAAQEILMPSTSKADLDMYAMALHEEEMHRMENAERHIPEDILTLAQVIDTDLGEPPETIFLSRVEEKKDHTYFSMLSDSGASRCVIGRGETGKRILTNHVVGFDSENKGWVHEDSKDNKNETIPTLRKKSIMVASGQTVDAIAIDVLKLGVEARPLLDDNTWSNETQTMFLTAHDSAVSKNIESTVWSEGHFLSENTKWTMISHNQEKYMVYAKVHLSLEGIGDLPPMKVDFREGAGGHYLDATSVITDLKQIKSKGNRPKQEIHPNRRMPHSDQATVNTIITHDEMNDTEDLDSYEEYVTVRHMTAEDKTKSHLRDTPESNTLTYPKCSKTTMTADECVKHVHETMESAQSEDWERLEAIEMLSKKVKELNDWKNYYTAKRAEIVQLHNIRTRSQSRSATKESVSNDTQETNATTASHDEIEDTEDTETNSQPNIEYVEAVDDFSSYEEYDKVYKASREFKKRVRFETRTIVDPEEINIHQPEPNSFKNNKQRSKVSKAERKLIQQQRKDELETETEHTDTEIDGKEKGKPIEDEYELYKDLNFSGQTEKGKVEMYNDDRFKDDSKIDDVSDVTLAIFLMENKVKL